MSNNIQMPERLGKYIIESVLGQGGMGVVYKGRDTAIDRYVALKTIRAELLETKDRELVLNRLQQEARAVGRCLHPNIVSVFDYGEDKGIPFIAMEYVEGLSLRQTLRKRKSFKPNTINYIVRQVLEALDCAHRNGIIHRDIKPDNILILTDGHVKVTDFGIARLDSTHLTRTGTICGTPNYMAPEQIRSNKITPAVDIYATGALMYELCTGKMPFEGETSIEIMYNVLEGSLDLDTSETAIPTEFRPIIAQALAKDPLNRFSSAQAFAAALGQSGQVPAGRAQHLPAAAFTPPPDATLLAPPPPTPSLSDSWTADELEEVEQSLARHLGPIAKHIVKRASREARSVDELCSRLSDNLQDENIKSDFLQRVQRTLGERARPSFADMPAATAKPAATAIDAETLFNIERELTPYLGPIARVLVRKQASRAGSVVELYRQLASHIPNQKEREAFLQNIESGAAV
jgi:serine/threonine-protein kinase